MGSFFPPFQVGTELSQHNLIAHILLDCFLTVEFWKSFVYYECKFSVRYVIYKCFLPVYVLSFYPLTCIFLRAKVFHFDEVERISFMDLMYQFHGLCFWFHIQELCLTYLFSPIFSSRSFKILDVAVRSMILFELIFVLGVKYRLMLIFWHVDIQDHLLKRLYIHSVAFLLLPEISWSYLCGLISGLFTLIISFPFDTTLPWLLQLYSNSWNHTV